MPIDEHGVDFHLLGRRDLGLDLIVAVVELGADLVGAELALNGAGVIDQRRLVADGQNAHLFRREPEREIAGVMLDQKSDETFVRAKRRAVNAERGFLGVIAVFVDETEPARLGEITWLVAMVNSRPMTLQTCTSIFGP